MKTSIFTIVFLYVTAAVGTFSSFGVQAKTVQSLMRYESLGLLRPFFEKEYGLAKRRLYGTSYLYVVKGCNVIVEFDAGDAVESIELVNLSHKCTFNTRAIGLDGPAHTLTYEKLISYSSDWNAQQSCYEYCGNASDPVYGVIVELPRAYQFLVVSGKTAYGTTAYDKVFESSFAVLKDLKARYPDLDFSGCLDKEVTETYNKIWFKHFKTVNINSLRFGGSSNDENCR